MRCSLRAATRPVVSARRGARDSLGFGLSTLVFGVLFGVAAAAQGFSALDAIVMSGLVFTASAQFATLSFWQQPLPLFSIAVSTLLISSRHVLLGLVLTPYLDRGSLKSRLLALCLLTDPNAILTMQARGVHRLGYFVGGGLMLYAAWLGGSALGVLAADWLATAYLDSLDFAGPLVLSTMLVLMAKSHARQWPAWLAAGVAAAGLAGLGVNVNLLLPLAVACGVCVASVGAEVRRRRLGRGPG